MESTYDRLRRQQSESILQIHSTGSECETILSIQREDHQARDSCRSHTDVAWGELETCDVRACMFPANLLRMTKWSRPLPLAPVARRNEHRVTLNRLPEMVYM